MSAVRDDLVDNRQQITGSRLRLFLIQLDVNQLVKLLRDSKVSRRVHPVGLGKRAPGRSAWKTYAKKDACRSRIGAETNGDRVSLAFGGVGAPGSARNSSVSGGLNSFCPINRIE